ncbi:hypothetical protein F2Q70_00018880 [Brassica cretica]|uniref:Phytocyanin domain-containing protein n=1 Tax=Brassica cretica TaxID=69181 RepID=A0A8S9HSC8_BRACR|nr:hypothetical protein F2Q70_00018880 [Brassica cretica]KAF2595614.1 hypothetical protein F2Q68_00012495 [Brassica cretica]
MALIKSNTFFTSLMILLALFGVGGTVHNVGDSSGWTIMTKHGILQELFKSENLWFLNTTMVFTTSLKSLTMIWSCVNRLNH